MRGERNKLTLQQRAAIQTDKRKGVIIAKEYGISPAAVCMIRRGYWAGLNKNLDNYKVTTNER